MAVTDSPKAYREPKRCAMCRWRPVYFGDVCPVCHERVRQYHKQRKEMTRERRLQDS